MTGVQTCALPISDANGTFKADDFVYQGTSFKTASAYGIVLNYSANTGKLVLGATQGQFTVNNNIHAVSTNGVCRLDSFEVNPLLLSEIKIEPNPIDALPTDDYGYDITITEPTNINN